MRILVAEDMEINRRAVVDEIKKSCLKQRWMHLRTADTHGKRRRKAGMTL